MENAHTSPTEVTVMEGVAKRPPYPFCCTPEKCAGKGYCPKDIACNN